MIAIGFAGLLDQIASTGEVRPQQISPTFDKNDLLSIDRPAVDGQPDPNGGVRAPAARSAPPERSGEGPHLRAQAPRPEGGPASKATQRARACASR